MLPIAFERHDQLGVAENGNVSVMSADDDLALALELSLVTEAMSGQTAHERRLRK